MTVDAKRQPRLIECRLTKLGLEFDLAVARLHVLDYVAAPVLVVRHQVMRQDLAQVAPVELRLSDLDF